MNLSEAVLPEDSCSQRSNAFSDSIVTPEVLSRLSVVLWTPSEIMSCYEKFGGAGFAECSRFHSGQVQYATRLVSLACGATRVASKSASSSSRGSEAGSSGDGSGLHGSRLKSVRSVGSRVKVTTRKMPAGYCYADLLVDGCVVSQVDRLGAYPSVASLLRTPASQFKPVRYLATKSLSGDKGLAHVQSVAANEGNLLQSFARYASGVKFPVGSLGAVVNASGVDFSLPSLAVAGATRLGAFQGPLVDDSTAGDGLVGLGHAAALAGPLREKTAVVADRPWVSMPVELSMAGLGVEYWPSEEGAPVLGFFSGQLFLGYLPLRLGVAAEEAARALDESVVPFGSWVTVRWCFSGAVSPGGRVVELPGSFRGVRRFSRSRSEGAVAVVLDESRDVYALADAGKGIAHRGWLRGCRGGNLVVYPRVSQDPLRLSRSTVNLSGSGAESVVFRQGGLASVPSCGALVLASDFDLAKFSSALSGLLGVPFEVEVGQGVESCEGLSTYVLLSSASGCTVDELAAAVTRCAGCSVRC